MERVLLELGARGVRVRRAPQRVQVQGCKMWQTKPLTTKLFFAAREDSDSVVEGTASINNPSCHKSDAAGEPNDAFPKSSDGTAEHLRESRAVLQVVSGIYGEGRARHQVPIS